MEEEQVQGKVPCPHLDWKLRADEAKIPAKLQQKILHPAEQCVVKVILTVFSRQAEELDVIGVLKTSTASGCSCPHRC